MGEACDPVNNKWLEIVFGDNGEAKNTRMEVQSFHLGSNDL